MQPSWNIIFLRLTPRSNRTRILSLDPLGLGPPEEHSPSFCTSLAPSLAHYFLLLSAWTFFLQLPLKRQLFLILQILGKLQFERQPFLLHYTIIPKVWPVNLLHQNDQDPENWILTNSQEIYMYMKVWETLLCTKLFNSCVLPSHCSCPLSTILIINLFNICPLHQTISSIKSRT